MTAAAYGFVGTGEISAAIITGLSTDAATAPPVFCSPRGRAVAAGLADRFRNVTVCASNQEVLEAADTVVLAVRPQDAEAVLTGLAFAPRHVAVSAIAAVRLDQLRAWTAPAGSAVRSIPLPPAATRQSMTAMYPDVPAARALFDRVGTALVPDDEQALAAFSAATASFAAHLDYLGTVAGWLAEHGVAPDTAATFVTHVFGRIGVALLESPGAIDALAGRHATPGGTNEQLRDELRAAGMPDALRAALDTILARVSGNT